MRAQRRSCPVVVQLTLLSLSLPVGEALAQHVILTKRVVDESSSFPTSVFPADMNADGRIDLLATSAGDDLVRMYLNNGGTPASFSALTVSSNPQAPQSVCAADLDGDGDPDIVTASYTDDRITWFLNDPMTPGFDRFVIDNQARGADTVITADLDQDGDLDVIAAAFDAVRFHWYRNDGASPPQFTKTEVTPMAVTSLTDVFAADLDADGDIDLLTASWYTGTIAWYESNGAATPAFTRHNIATDAPYAFSVSAADLDGDGNLDVLSASHLDNKVAWYESDGGTPPQFTSHVVSTTVYGANDAAAADVDQDGDLDIVAVGESDIGVHWFENVGGAPPQFVAQPVLPTIDGGRHVALADLDGDGDLDFLTASTADNTLAWYAQEQVVNLTQDSRHRTIAAAISPAQGGDTLDTPAAAFLYEPEVDLLGKALMLQCDGALEQPRGGVMTLADGAAITASGAIELGGELDLPGGATCTLSAPALQSLSQSSVMLHASSLLTASSLAQLTLGGATTLEGGAAITVGGDLALGGARPEFVEHAVPVATPGWTPNVQAGDVDGDGDIDLVAVFGSYSPDKTLNWYENDGAYPPSFTERLIYSPMYYCESVALADVDLDGDLDVLTATKGDDQVAWYENNGAATPSFTKRVIDSIVPGFWSVTTSDVNRDGRLDVVACSDVQLYWYENTGGSPAGFVRRTPGIGVFFPNALAVWDPDGDGDPDVLLGSEATDEIAWAENNGAPVPSFTKRIISTGLEDKPGLAVADLDGDGDADILARGQFNDVISWYENPGGSNPTFARHVITSSAPSVTGVVPHDLDGDGDLDFIAASEPVIGGPANGLTWYESDGAATPTFTRRVIDSALFVLAVTLANLDGDARPEIIASENSSGSGLAWFSIEPGGPVAAGAGARLSVGGSVTSIFADHALLDWSAATLEMSGAGETLEVMSKDIGASPDGLDRTQPGHFPLGEFHVATGASIALVDLQDNDGLGNTQCEALYADTVVIESGATVSNATCRIYYGTLSLDGIVTNPENLIALPPACPGDLNGDQQVDLSDLGVVLADYGCSGGACAGDLDADGDTDLSDLGIVLSAYGLPCE